MYKQPILTSIVCGEEGVAADALLPSVYHPVQEHFT